MRFNFEMLEIIFSKVALKIHLNLINASGEIFSFDNLKKEAKIYLLNSVLTEFKRFIINGLYYKTKNQDFMFKPDTFFELILLKVKKTVEKEFCFLQSRQISSFEFKWAIRYLEKEDGELFNLFLSIISLIGDRQEVLYINGFDKLKLIMALLENLVIKLSSVFIYVIFLNFDVKQLVYRGFFYSDIDFLKIKKNDFYWYSYLNATFLKPKYIYYNLYNIKVLNKYGISSRLIYLPTLHMKEVYKFSNIQLSILFYFELIDFIYPKTRRIFLKSQQILRLIFE
jgi:hypothetical protein